MRVVETDGSRGGVGGTDDACGIGVASAEEHSKEHALASCQISRVRIFEEGAKLGISKDSAVEGGDRRQDGLPSSNGDK